LRPATTLRTTLSALFPYLLHCRSAVAKGPEKKFLTGVGNRFGGPGEVIEALIRLFQQTGEMSTKWMLLRKELKKKTNLIKVQKYCSTEL
jgi:hypothetical protein